MLIGQCRIKVALRLSLASIVAVSFFLFQFDDISAQGIPLDEEKPGNDVGCGLTPLMGEIVEFTFEEAAGGFCQGGENEQGLVYETESRAFVANHILREN